MQIAKDRNAAERRYKKKVGREGAVRPDGPLTVRDKAIAREGGEIGGHHRGGYGENDNELDEDKYELRVVTDKNGKPVQAKDEETGELLFDENGDPEYEYEEVLIEHTEESLRAPRLSSRGTGRCSRQRGGSLYVHII